MASQSLQVACLCNSTVQILSFVFLEKLGGPERLLHLQQVRSQLSVINIFSHPQMFLCYVSFDPPVLHLTKTHQRDINMMSFWISDTYAYTSVLPALQHEQTSAHRRMDGTTWCAELITRWIVFPSEPPNGRPPPPEVQGEGHPPTSGPAGTPWTLVLWGRFTSASSCLLHPDCLNKAGVNKERPETSTYTCFSLLCWIKSWCSGVFSEFC